MSPTFPLKSVVKTTISTFRAVRNLEIRSERAHLSLRRRRFLTKGTSPTSRELSLNTRRSLSPFGKKWLGIHIYFFWNAVSLFLLEVKLKIGLLFK
ncbi:hypothetical protein CEXT_692791 [Caerostris extrusa]|uniref:Uncharacterized protein n=1 Tax=Caerostris extrusa TaxID=172846 RepID=A0AAV4NVT1_CAEEX|nr:hypothetical protein CEXT_692791 [Caerostris extrusa]